MAKLTKAQRQTITMALNATNALIAYIERPDIAFCKHTEINEKVQQGPNEYRARESHRSQHYIGKDREWDIHYVNQMSPMDKGIGSPLVQRYDIKRALERLLED